MMISSCTQPVTLNEIKWGYRDPNFAAGRDVMMRPDGRLEMDFTWRYDDIRSTLKALLPPVEEWMWDINGIPIDPMELLREKDDAEETKIGQFLPRWMCGVNMKYLFGRFEKECGQYWLQIDPWRVEQATHVLLQIHDDKKLSVLPALVDRRSRGMKICWKTRARGEWGNLGRVCYEIYKSGDDLSTRWYVCEMPKEMEPARQYWAEQWKDRMRAGKETFENFLKDRECYKERMMRFLPKVPSEWEILLDARGDGQFLQLLHHVRSHGSGGGGEYFARDQFRYDKEGEEKLKRFLS